MKLRRKALQRWDGVYTLASLAKPKWRKKMPSSSKKQHRFMEAIAHNPEFAKRAGVPTKVGKDFVRADEAEGKAKKGKKR